VQGQCVSSDSILVFSNLYSEQVGLKWFRWATFLFQGEALQSSWHFFQIMTGSKLVHNNGANSQKTGRRILFKCPETVRGDRPAATRNKPLFVWGERLPWGLYLKNTTLLHFPLQILKEMNWMNWENLSPYCQTTVHQILTNFPVGDVATLQLRKFMRKSDNQFWRKLASNCIIIIIIIIISLIRQLTKRNHDNQ